MTKMNADAIDRTSLALSVRQPYASRILRGVKKEEWRSRPTKIRGRVLIYAASVEVDELTTGERGAWTRGHMASGKIVGDVEIVDCVKYQEPVKFKWQTPYVEYAWILANPRTLSTPLKPSRRANPVWFRPWGEDGRG